MSWLNLASRVVVTTSFMAWAGCDTGASAADTPAEATSPAPTPESTPTADGAPPQTSGETAADGSAAQAPAAPLVSLWVGLYCDPSDDGGVQRFSFYVDGTEVQQMETTCNGEPEPGTSPPNGGQFRVPVAQGVRVLRIQDDTGDYHSEHDVAVPGDHWVFVHHRTLPGGTGHLTSVIDRYEAPRFAY